MDDISHFPIFAGRIGRDYKIDFDARMGRKVFMQAHAVKQFGGKVFWIDADSITHSPVPADFLDSVLPSDKFCCFLGRDGWFYTESGFIGFNADHPIAKDFFATYVQILLSGVIFTRKWWHDCAAFDAAREIFYKRFGDEPFVDLAKDLPGQCLHPFVNSVIGAYCDHRKGRRKTSRTDPSELVVKRTEAYWQEKNDKEKGPSQSPSIILPATSSPPFKRKDESLTQHVASATAARS